MGLIRFAFRALLSTPGSVWLLRTLLGRFVGDMAFDGDDTPLMRSIVLLYPAPPALTGEQIERAAKNAFGLTIHINTPPPIDGHMTELRQIALSDEESLVVYAVNKPYALPESDDPEAFLKEGNLLQHSQAQQGWIAVDYVGDEEDDELIFRQLGRMAAELADLLPPSLIYTPTYQRLFVWDDSRRELLRSVEPREAFGPGPWVAADHTIFNVATDNSDMERAIQQAQERLPEFLSAFGRRTSDDHFLLKARFTSGDDVEHMWLSPTKLGDGVIHGKLECEPHHIPNLKLGSPVTVAHEDVSDWAMKVGDQEPVGMFTEAIVRAGTPSR
jgi:uncharacterized protein YegJ (DUF2314 family)